MSGDEYGKFHTRLILVLVLAAVFLSYYSPMRTGDPWWHLNNGRWIVENGMLPSVDHFMHTTSPEPSLNKTFVLQSYWLSQSLMYLTYMAAGFHGLVAAKALVFTLMFFMVYLCLRTGGLGVAESAATVAPAALILRFMGESRPHILSFLMCITVFYLLERTREREGRGRKMYPLLPLSLALWANLHGGYIIGMGMIGIYLVVGALRFLMHGKDHEAGRSFSRSLWLLGSILAAGLNPSGFKAIKVTLMQLSMSRSENIVDEYIPTLEFARMTGDQYMQIGLVAVGIIASLVLILSWRRLRLEHLLLFIIFGYAGFSYYRFSAFFVLIAMAVAGLYTGELFTRISSRARVPDWMRQGAALAIAFWVMVLTLGSGNTLKGAVDSRNTPLGAVSVISTFDLPGEIYNPYEWGGYLGWWLYPKHKVFMDGRNIDKLALRDYQRAKGGDLSVLSERGVNTVVFYNLTGVRFGSRVPGVILSLLNDPSWELVYYDQLSSIFVRSSALDSEKLIVGKELLWQQIEDILVYWAETEPSDHRPHAELAALYAARGLFDKAEVSLKRSLAIKPGNAEAKSFMRYDFPAKDANGPDKEE